MSRRRIAALLAFVATIGAISPAFAQDGAWGSPPERIDLTVPRPTMSPTEEACLRQREAAIVSGEIVVCGGGQPVPDQRITSREEAQTRYAAATMDRGLGSKPDFRPSPCRPSLVTFCLKVGGAPTAAIEVDLASLPEASRSADAAILEDEVPRL